MAETKEIVVGGVKTILQMCWNKNDSRCLGWFQKTRKGKESCSQRCAAKKTASWKKQHTFKTKYNISARHSIPKPKTLLKASLKSPLKTTK